MAEIDQVWKATYQHHSDTYGALIRLLILSAQRKGQWLAFDPAFIQGDTIVFPGAVMKMGKSHTLPLTDGMRREIGNRATFGRLDDKLLQTGSRYTLRCHRATACMIYGEPLPPIWPRREPRPTS